MKPSKVLIDSPQSQTTEQVSLPSKLLDSFPNPNSNFPANFFYEPTSVLDPHLTSSPAASAATGGGGSEVPPLPWDSHHQHHFVLPPPPPPPPSDDWDPVSWLLPEKDDLSKPPHHLQFDFSEGDSVSYASLFDGSFDLPDPDPLPPFFDTAVTVFSPTPAFDRTHLELLLRAAHSVESSDFATAHAILARLNRYLPTSAGSPLQRVAFHFKEALLTLLPLPDRPTAEPPLSDVEIVRRISASKAFSDLSLVPKFVYFTANQSLLDALDAAAAASVGGGHSSVHLIDFEIGLGGQWSSFAQDVAARSRAARAPPPGLRITSVVPEETRETTLAAENLRDFARGLGLRLAVDFVSVGNLGTLALSGIRLVPGEPVAVVLTPTIFRVLGGPESIAALLRFVRLSSPCVVVFVDTECSFSSGAAVGQLPSLRRSVTVGIEHYAAVLESVEAAGPGKERVRWVERTVVRPRIFSAVGWLGSGRGGGWREALAGAGMAPVGFSEFAELQAECLVRWAPVDGYHVAKGEGSMVLSWRGKELAATSVWRC